MEESYCRVLNSTIKNAYILSEQKINAARDRRLTELDKSVPADMNWFDRLIYADPEVAKAEVRRRADICRKPMATLYKLAQCNDDDYVVVSASDIDILEYWVNQLSLDQKQPPKYRLDISL